MSLQSTLPSLSDCLQQADVEAEVHYKLANTLRELHTKASTHLSAYNRKQISSNDNNNNCVTHIQAALPLLAKYACSHYVYALSDHMSHPLHPAKNIQFDDWFRFAEKNLSNSVIQHMTQAILLFAPSEQTFAKWLKVAPKAGTCAYLCLHCFCGL